MNTGQDTIPKGERRNLIMAENPEFSRTNFHDRLVEFQLLGVQNGSAGLHADIFRQALKFAAADLTETLRQAHCLKNPPEVPKKLLRKAHLLLWEVRHYYTPSSNTFLTNGAEEVIQSLVYYHDKIKLFLSRNHPGILQDTGKHQPSFGSGFKPRTTQPYARRKRYNFQRQRFCQADQEHFELSGPQV